MATPTAADVADFLGQSGDPTVVALAGEHLPIITAMARAYTRGAGFTDGAPNEEIAAVITTATARLMAHPTQLEQRVGETYVRQGFHGWTLAETFTLNRYRRTAL